MFVPAPCKGARRFSRAPTGRYHLTPRDPGVARYNHPSGDAPPGTPVRAYPLATFFGPCGADVDVARYIHLPAKKHFPSLILFRAFNLVPRSLDADRAPQA